MKLMLEEVSVASLIEERMGTLVIVYMDVETLLVSHDIKPLQENVIHNIIPSISHLCRGHAISDSELSKLEEMILGIIAKL